MLPPPSSRARHLCKSARKSARTLGKSPLGKTSYTVGKSPLRKSNRIIELRNANKDARTMLDVPAKLNYIHRVQCWNLKREIRIIEGGNTPENLATLREVTALVISSRAEIGIAETAIARRIVEIENLTHDLSRIGFLPAHTGGLLGDLLAPSQHDTDKARLLETMRRV